MEDHLSRRAARILLVEDDRDLREIVGEILSGVGYEVQFATNGQEALDSLRQGPLPELVLLDLRMPVKDGFEFLAEQQREPAIADVAVVAMSADDGVTGKLSGLAIRGWLKKPVEMEELLETCRKHCG